MLRTDVLRRAVRKTAIGVCGTTFVGASSLTIYANTEKGLGFKREVDFWSNVAPIVWDYWWNSFEPV